MAGGIIELLPSLDVHIKEDLEVGPNVLVLIRAGGMVFPSKGKCGPWFHTDPQASKDAMISLHKPREIKTLLINEVGLVNDANRFGQELVGLEVTLEMDTTPCC
jgi:hypothetical protein